MEVHACLENCERGLFITLDENSYNYDPDTNPRVEKELEKKILEEFRDAKFELLNDDLSIANTENFIFRKREAEKEDKIIWVEPVLQEDMNKVIL